MKTPTLFKQPPPRRHNGQFCTKEMAYADKQAEENKFLKLEVEKYKRAYFALADENSLLKRKLLRLKEILL